MKNIKIKDIRMKKIAVIDLECTCDDKGSIERKDMEIIEIGVAIADMQGNTYNEFNVFVRPVKNQILTDFCKELTSIKQEDVDKGESLENALILLNAFLAKENVDLWGSWGYFDKNKIKKESERLNLDLTQIYFIEKLPFINISDKYYKHQGLSRKCGVRKALAQKRMKFIGTPHRGIDDVRNTARLLPFIGGV